jgi:hypothetical protein
LKDLSQFWLYGFITQSEWTGLLVNKNKPLLIKAALPGFCHQKYWSPAIYLKVARCHTVTPEDTIVCLCTRQKFETIQQQALIDIYQSQPIQWDNVYETAHQHQVSPLVYVNLSKFSNEELDISPTVLSRFKKAQIRNVFVKKRTNVALEKVLALFSRKGIDVMLVKGEALSHLVYEQPWYTISQDIDLIIRARVEDLAEADHREILELLDGYNHERHAFKEHIEYDFYEHHDVTMNNVLAVDWERICPKICY